MFSVDTTMLDLLETHVLTSKEGLDEEDRSVDGASWGTKLSVGAVVGLHMGLCVSGSSISGT